MRKKKVLKIISIVVVIAVTVLILFLVILRKGNKRSLRINEVQGDASITRDDINKIELYKNMPILSGDSLVLNNGILTLFADKDKYIYFDEKTEMQIEMSGTRRESETEIALQRGAISLDFRKKLSNNSTFVITTSNVSVSTRGDIFRVETYEEDNLLYTRVSVYKGDVKTKLLLKDGSESEEELSVVAGNEVIICEDENNTWFMSQPVDIDYARLPAPFLKKLKKASESKRGICLRTDEIDQLLEEKATVTFKYNEKIFGVETVEKNSVITATPTDPTVSGGWDYDFSKPVKEDIEIEWKQNSSETGTEN